MITTTTTEDWAALYKSLDAQGKVPGASSSVIDTVHAEFRGMYADLADIKAKIMSSGYDPPLVTVIVDVLNIPAGTTWLLQNAALVIQARRVQIDGSFKASLDYRTGITASLALFCQQLEGSIQAAAVTAAGPPATFAISEPPAGGGVQLSLRDGIPVQTALVWAQGIAVPPTSTFVQALRTEFLFASLMYDLHPDIAVSQLSWIKCWSGYSPELLGTFLRSSSLLALLTASIDAEANGTVFVPYLTRQVYTDLATAFVNEARQYESDYRSLSLEKTVTENFIKLAKTLLANKTAESAYAASLQQQAKANFDNATLAVEAAEKTLRDAQRTAELLAIDFKERGIPEWERAEIAKAIISLGTAVITFAVGIAAMFVGDEAAGPAAAGAAIEAAKAAEAAAETGSAVAKLAQQLEKVMTDLKKVGEILQKLFELSKVIVEVVGDFQHAGDYAGKMRSLNVDSQGADLTATYQWQVYQQKADASLQSPIDSKIEFAADLKLALDAVAVYGQAVAAAHVAAISAGQRYAAASLQKQLAEQEQAQLQQYVDSLVVDEAPVDAMMQLFYQRYLDAKSSLFSAIQGYRASYYYWALQPSNVQPKIIDGVDGLDTGLSNLTAISLDAQTALEHFSPPPQQLEEALVVVTDPAVLAELASDGTARWTLGLDAQPFSHWDRVRLTRVRIWLEGAKPGTGDNDTIDLAMSTQGNYLDRFGSKQFQFTSRPLTRSFQYRVAAKRSVSPDWRFEDGSFGYVVEDGAVDNEVSYAYFQPTPFAEWQLTVHGKVDLSKVTKITMALAGSVIPNQS